MSLSHSAFNDVLTLSYDNTAKTQLQLPCLIHTSCSNPCPMTGLNTLWELDFGCMLVPIMHAQFTIPLATQVLSIQSIPHCLACCLYINGKLYVCGVACYIAHMPSPSLRWWHVSDNSPFCCKLRHHQSKSLHVTLPLHVEGRAVRWQWDFVSHRSCLSITIHCTRKQCCEVAWWFIGVTAQQLGYGKMEGRCSMQKDIGNPWTLSMGHCIRGIRTSMLKCCQDGDVEIVMSSQLCGLMKDDENIGRWGKNIYHFDWYELHSTLRRWFDDAQLSS